ncbi:hypothetical protein ACH5RR_032961 [Cinchona calisaya]|uniref:Uncharacterized protein n=1 Tax=Cinchona calisaya TaxID=153742 RepID=A0ABD2YNT7_9GENT
MSSDSMTDPDRVVVEGRTGMEEGNDKISGGVGGTEKVGSKWVSHVNVEVKTLMGIVDCAKTQVDTGSGSEFKFICCIGLEPWVTKTTKGPKSIIIRLFPKQYLKG